MNFYNYTNADRHNRLFVPIFGNCTYSSENPFSFIYEAVNYFELFLISTLSIASFIFLIILRKSRRFHANLSLLFADMILHFYQYLFGRLLLLSYQIGFLKITGKPQFDLPLIIGSFFWLHSLFSLSMFPVAVIIERLFAIKYIEEYEHETRRWIPFTISIIKMSIAAISAYMVLLNFYRRIFLIAVLALPAVVIFAGFACVSLAIMLKWNRRKLEEMTSTIPHRTLSAHYLSRRFQLSENIQVLLLLRGLMLISFIGTGLISMLVAVAICCSNENGNLTQILFTLFNISPVMYQESYLLCILFLVESWRNDYIAIIQRIFFFIEIRQRRKIFVDHVQSREHARLYFELYEKSWK